MKTLKFPFQIIGKGLLYLFKDRVLTSTSGAEFATSDNYSSYLNSWNKGLLLDGVAARLSEKESYQNVCVTASVGTGKSTRYIIPNVLDKARRNCSLVVNDPKGEVFESTSAHMKQNGYNVIVIDPENLERSSHFNPLSEAKDTLELEQVAEILVRSGLPGNGGKDDFWVQGAIRFVSVLLKCLKNAGEENPEWLNLANLQYLFQNFGTDGSPLDDFIANYSVDIEDPSDERLFNEWKGAITGNPEGVQSFVLNALTALKALSVKNIAQITSKSDIDLESIRHKKTIIYFITPAQHAEFYGFLTSLFFRSVFNACMRKMPDKSTLPVYVLYDEFGHSSLPGFVSTANTIRGYKVSLSIILQSISQLSARYGQDYAQSILGGFNTYIAYSAAEPKTAEFFENIIGKVRERQKRNLEDLTSEYREYNLINASEVRTISEDEALLVSGNRQPVKLKATPYYKNFRLKRMANKGSCGMPVNNLKAKIQYVRLKD